MKRKLANRSDRQQRGPGKHHRRVGHNGLSVQQNGKFLQLTPEEVRARAAAARKLAFKTAEARGLGVVSNRVEGQLRAAGVPTETMNVPGHSGSHATVSLVPSYIADMVKAWEEAQVFAGPMAHDENFRNLKLQTVVELAIVEWQEREK